MNQPVLPLLVSKKQMAAMLSISLRSVATLSPTGDFAPEESEDGR
jgi:hypothetical protein